MTERRCLLSVHAHPDDESSKGAGLVARYHAEGVRTVLVTCTGGEEGDILNPAMDRPEVRADLPAVRQRELARAAEIIGFDDVVMLGYRDSGMPDSEANRHPEAFAQAPLEEAVARLVRVIRATRPQVMLTYHEVQEGYRHPDHLRVNEISVHAFEAAGDPARFPDAGAPFAPSKLYYSIFSMEHFVERHRAFERRGLESPYSDERFAGWFARAPQPATTRVDLGEFASVRLAALRAHETQVDPTSTFWFGLPDDVEADIFGYELLELARSNVGPISDDETDLFSGIPATQLV